MDKDRTRKSSIHRLRICAVLIFLTMPGAFLPRSLPNAEAQSSAKRTRATRREQVQEDPISAAVSEAEHVLDRKDYAAAEKTLNDVVAQNSGDAILKARAWSDLGFAYDAQHRSTDAIAAYRKAVSLKPDEFDSSLNLGILLAAEGQKDEAAATLRKATQLKPASRPAEQLERAWLLLATALTPDHPSEALAALRHAMALRPTDPQPHLSAAVILEKSQDSAGAEKEYQQTLALDAKSAEAMAGLVHLYLEEKRWPEATSMLHRYIAMNPADAAAHAQLARALLEQQQPDDAQKELEAALAAAPANLPLLRDAAAFYNDTKQYQRAEMLYRQAIKQAPKDAASHAALGEMLLRARRFPEAAAEFVAALKINPNLTSFYYDLALAFSENKNYQTVIKVLDARAQHVPDDARAYFLRATAYDHLREYKEAAVNYRQFLVTANGKYSNEEWEARHRLKAIDPTGK